MKILTIAWRIELSGFFSQDLSLFQPKKKGVGQKKGKGRGGGDSSVNSTNFANVLGKFVDFLDI
jgi:hypothetical protein